MDPHSPNKLFATKYCFLIFGDEFLFLNHFFIFRVFFLLFYVILLLLIFTKTMLLLSFNLNFFFHENYFYFFMFRDVPECSMFRVLSTPKRAPQEYINEFIIQKLNPLLVVDFRLISAFLPV